MRKLERKKENKGGVDLVKIKGRSVEERDQELVVGRWGKVPGSDIGQSYCRSRVCGGTNRHNRSRQCVQQ